MASPTPSLKNEQETPSPRPSSDAPEVQAPPLPGLPHGAFRAVVFMGQENTPLALDYQARHLVFHRSPGRLCGPWAAGAESRTQPWRLAYVASPATCLLRWEASEARA